jgi:hypothetical protein
VKRAWSLTIRSDQANGSRETPGDSRTTVLPALRLGLPGFVVLVAAEYGGPLELAVETTDTVTGCPDCGVVAARTLHTRHESECAVHAWWRRAYLR